MYFLLKMPDLCCIITLTSVKLPPLHLQTQQALHQEVKLPLLSQYWLGQEGAVAPLLAWHNAAEHSAQISFMKLETSETKPDSWVNSDLWLITDQRPRRDFSPFLWYFQVPGKLCPVGRYEERKALWCINCPLSSSLPCPPAELIDSALCECGV